RAEARDVAVVLARLIRVAEDDVVEAGWIQLGAVGDRAHDDGREVVGAHARERAARAAEGGAHGVVDEGMSHACSFRSRPVSSRSSSSVLSPNSSRTAKPSSVTSKTARSVYTRVTQPTPVSGYVHSATSFGSPCLVSRSVMTKTCFAPIARSMAPPTAGIAPGAPVDQFARSPFC